MATDTVQQVKDKLSIVDVIQPYVKLRPAGRSYTGLCPFHKEKTPSFYVSLERGSWHCFGCGEGGDAFTFIEKIEGVDFKGALKLLADKAGVTLEYTRGEDRSKSERLREAMNAAAQFYAGQLGTSGAAYDYARSRGLNPQTITDWMLGYAPDSWRALLEHMSTKGFSIDELRLAGLIKEADGKPGTYYDRFRARLMFPIRDIAGHVVAFTGRALDKEEQAKYLNSPETELYHKSDLLFGLDRAKDAIRTRGFVILVEGQMDLLHAHQAGWTNTVALSGTALTERHVALMKRYSENLLLVLDADAAGLSATAKSATLTLRQGLRVKAARLPSGKDPADLISEDAQEFARRIKEAKPVVEFFLAVLSEREKDQHRLVALVERIVLPLVASMQSPLEREHFAAAVARSLGLSTESVRESLARLSRNGEAAPRVVKDTGPVPAALSRSDLIAAVIEAYPESALAKRVESEYTRITEASVPGETPRAALFEAERLFGETPAEHAADDLLRAFEEAVIREAYQEAVVRLRKAESSNDQEAMQEAEARCAALSARLAKLR